MITTTHISGTVAVENGSTIVTGTGSAWLRSALRAEDLFSAQGLSVRIAAVESDTRIILAAEDKAALDAIDINSGWPG